MNLYLDDDSLQTLLVRLLREAGHDIVRSTDAGIEGASDSVHFTKAIELNRVLRTRNQKDFVQLHTLVLAATGHHPGILIVTRENNPRRDLTPRGIVNALRKLQDSGIAVFDTLFDLNAWR